MQVKDRVFILKKTRYGDADLILHALNPKGARLSLFARSALKSKKRFGGGVLEPTHYISVLYDEKTHRQNENPLHSLREALLIDDFPKLRSDFERLETALHFVQLVHDVSREGDVHSQEIFNLLGHSLKAAEVSTQLGHLRTHFEVKLLAQQGVLHIQEDEAKLLRTPILQHEIVDLDERLWRQLSARAQLGFRELRSL